MREEYPVKETHPGFSLVRGLPGAEVIQTKVHHHLLRVIIDGPLPGAENMARDEAILEAVGRDESPPTLRFYQWDQPTISLGYFQKVAELHEQDEVIRRLPAVRRLTGGGAILHDEELTYALVLPLGRNLPHTDIKAAYELVHDAYLSVITDLGVPASYRGGHDHDHAQRGPFFCFSRDHCLDLVVGQDKLMGSAQRRIKHAVLQHGSLILKRHFLQQPSAEIEAGANRELDLDLFMKNVADRIAHPMQRQCSRADLSAAEIDRAGFFLEKYRGPDWHAQR